MAPASTAIERLRLAKRTDSSPTELRACCDGAGVKHEEPATVDGTGVCNTLFPVPADVRIFAGGPFAGDILKCQLKPVAASDYAVSFAPSEWVRLNSIFPQGVCDWSKPGVNQSPLDDNWLHYVPPAPGFAWAIRVSATIDFDWPSGCALERTTGVASNPCREISTNNPACNFGLLCHLVTTSNGRASDKPR